MPVTDPKLRESSRTVGKVDKKILSIVKDLKETLASQKDPEGVGLAAPQIGKLLKIFVMLDAGELKAVINPEIVNVSQKKSGKLKKGEIMEGCLSLPHYYGPLKRPKKITIKYLDEEGSEKVEDFVGFTAQIVQHEIDHLNGILFIDRLLTNKKPLYKLVKDEWEEVELT
ncbi:MAG: peptide deformylase [Candidatus Curtissbacteria bacterium GW2011_GWC1_44_33]|uniref:Peptide deformylase n=1 Tax=Candidatus Curtissbacteria bacterium GW2011_GWC1_44_33 TaxID=1618413 RepID=A0A0G1J6Q7_9BACT|nr:MAG: peptide deformylase [Candidatus Curtissbacteria bacterium GW2011_GWC1_44_33]